MERDVVAEVHQRIAKVGDDALGPAVQPWRYRFIQRSDLRNAQRSIRRWSAGKLLRPSRLDAIHDGSS